MDKHSRGGHRSSKPDAGRDADIRKHLRKLRLEAGMTQAQVAKAMNMERSVYSKYETGKLRLNQDFLERFSRIFQLRVEDLEQAVMEDHPENQTAEWQSEELRQRLNIRFSTEKPDYLPAGHWFIGRKWLVQQVETWLDDPSGSQMYVLYGDLGIGKSSFSARLVHSSTRVPGGMFCDGLDSGFQDPRMLIRTLSFLLASRIPDYRLALMSAISGRDHLENLDAQELFELLIASPMKEQLLFEDDMETLCVVVDGIDACSLEDVNEPARLLTAIAPRLPRWVRILVTARETDSVKDALRDVPHLELHGTEERNLEDVREYFSAMLKKRFGDAPYWKSALEDLTWQSGGIFLRAQAMAESILGGRMAIRNLDPLPEGLSPAFHRWFAALFPDEEEYRQLWGPGIAMILASPEPIPREELRRTLGWSGEQEQTFFRRMKLLLRTDVSVFGRETVEIPDRYLRLWLADTSPERDSYAVHLHSALTRMADTFYARMKRKPKTLTGYEALYLEEFLGKTCRKKQAEEAGLSRDLALRLLSAGDACIRSGNPQAAERFYESARRIAMRLVRKSATSESCYLYAVACTGLGDSRSTDSEAAEDALPDYQEGLKWAGAALKRNPDHPMDCYGSILYGCGKAAAILTGAERLEEALQICDYGLETAESRVLRDGGSEQKWLLCKLYRQKARTWLCCGDEFSAADLYEKGISMLAGIRKEDPGFGQNAEAAVLQSEAAKLRRKMENLPRAEALFRAAEEEADLALRHDPANRQILTGLLETCNALIEILDSTEKTGEAWGYRNKYITVLEQMIAGHADCDRETRCEDCRRMVESGIETGAVDLFCFQDDRACEILEEVVQCAQVLREEGDSFLWDCYESRARFALSYILKSRGDIQRSEEQYSRSEALLKQAGAYRKEMRLQGSELPPEEQKTFNFTMMAFSLRDILQGRCSEISKSVDEKNMEHLHRLLACIILLVEKCFLLILDGAEKLINTMFLDFCQSLIVSKQYYVDREEYDQNVANMDGVLALTEQITSESLREEKILCQAKAWMVKGESTILRGDRAEALPFFQKAEELFFLIPEENEKLDWYLVCGAAFLTAGLQQERGDLSLAEENFRKCIDLTMKHIPRLSDEENLQNRFLMICESYAHLAVILRAKGDTEAVQECYRKIQEEIEATSMLPFPLDQMPAGLKKEDLADAFRLAIVGSSRERIASYLRGQGDLEGAEIFEIKSSLFNRELMSYWHDPENDILDSLLDQFEL